VNCDTDDIYPYAHVLKSSFVKDELDNKSVTFKLRRQGVWLTGSGKFRVCLGPKGFQHIEIVESIPHLNGVGFTVRISALSRKEVETIQREQNSEGFIVRS
jgi:hypothetical protein